MTQSAQVSRQEFEQLASMVAGIADMLTRKGSADETSASASPASGTKSPTTGKAKRGKSRKATTPKGSAVRHDASGWWLVGEADVPAHCTALVADGTGRCGQTEGLDADGRCRSHTVAAGGQPAPKGLIGRRFARAIRRAERLAKQAEGEATTDTVAEGDANTTTTHVHRRDPRTGKASTKSTTVKRTSDPGVTCKGRTKSGGACGRWVGLDEHGYCASHEGQYQPKAATGEVVVATATTAATRPEDV